MHLKSAPGALLWLDAKRRKPCKKDINCTISDTEMIEMKYIYLLRRPVKEIYLTLPVPHNIKTLNTKDTTSKTNKYNT